MRLPTGLTPAPALIPHSLPRGWASNVILVPHAKAVQQYARQEAADTIGQGEARRFPHIGGIP